jgi:hypothetical protein
MDIFDVETVLNQLAAGKPIGELAGEPEDAWLFAMLEAWRDDCSKPPAQADE